ncbi:hypothetical protein GCM10011575_25040 [Microlunatus endophyticus]|uniref:Uncharacterized protein n=1 Tax=Microlunatus endophyticus TaxID=1716077 RepID=A0A917SBC1_9ACTN|nr:hypothetical protein [Microlunatus endophyticus]GGL65619.1 hypothetical protein GCM10011575_25040 [Microlunatus endophyticus]
MELDEVARELYDGSPDDFVEIRKARAAEARSAGDRELAKQITALRRPTRSAWVVNLLSFQADDELAGLLDLGAALAQAQQRLSGDDLRQLSRQRNTAISALVRRGSQLAQVRGHRPSEATLREVTDTLQAALSDPGVAEVVRNGRLTQPQSYGGFGPEMIFAPAESRAEPPEPAPGTAPEDDQATPDERLHQQRLDELATAQQALDRLEVQLTRVEEQVQRAAEDADRRSQRLTELRDQLRRAEREADRADAELERLSSERDDLRSAREEAEEQVSQALSRLAGD